MKFIILLILMVNTRSKKHDELLALMTQQMQTNADALRSDIQLSVNDGVQKANSQLRIEMNESMSRLSQSQNQNMVAFADLIRKMIKYHHSEHFEKV